MGLLLLRAVAGGAAAGQAGSYLLQGGESGAASWILGVAAILAGAGLVAGFLTPGAAVAVGLATLLMAANASQPVAGALVMDPRSAALVIADALALAMLGPGAHSIDAWLFGRREIIVSRDPLSR